jgi:hypothetical protein
MLAATLGSQFNLPPLPSAPPPPPTFAPCMHLPSPQVTNYDYFRRAREVDETNYDYFRRSSRPTRQTVSFSSAVLADEKKWIFIGCRRKCVYFLNFIPSAYFRQPTDEYIYFRWFSGYF